MTDILEVLLILLVVYPINILLHELSHATAVKICGGELVKINLGTGKIVFRIGKIYVHTWYWYGGEFFFRNLRSESKFSQIIVFLFGPLSNLFLAMILIIVKIKIGPNEIMDVFTTWALIVFASSLLPTKFAGKNSDGRQIIQILKTGSSIYITRDKTQNNA